MPAVDLLVERLGAGPARVRRAEAAVPGNGLLYALLEAAHAAVFLDGAEAQALHGAPRTFVVIGVIVGVAGMPAEQNRCRHGGSQQNDAHGSSSWPKASLIFSYY